MGKWTKLKSELVKFVQPDSWQQKIDKFKFGTKDQPGYNKLTRAQMCQEWLVVTKKKEKLKDELADLNTREEALDQLLVDMLESEGDSSFRNEAGTFFIKDDPYCSVIDKAAYNAWIKEQGLEELMTVNYQTTSGMTKERLEKGEPVPPGIKVFMKTSIGHRRPTA